MARATKAELDRWRTMDASHVLSILGTYSKSDSSYVPVKQQESERWHVTVAGRDFEILTTGPKFYDTRLKRGGGGAIDLTMHVLGLDFKAATAKLRQCGI